MEQLVTDLARTVEAWLDTQGYGSDDPCDEDGNGALLAASVAGRTALGTRAGARVRRLQRATTRPPKVGPPLSNKPVRDPGLNAPYSPHQRMATKQRTRAFH